MRNVGVLKDFQLEDCVAIIGPRKASPQECKVAYQLAKKCVEKGKIVVSGLAAGIDTYAHKGALDAGGRTIAILSTSEVEPIYPNFNKGLAERITKQGCLIHPYELSAIEADKRYGAVHPNKKRHIVRLLERDILLASMCPYIMAVSDERVTGGTRWGVNYGVLFGHNVQQFGGDGKSKVLNYSRNVEIDWKIELNIPKLKTI